MKKLLLTLALAGTALLASAQNIFDSADNHRFFGVRASYELSCPTDVKFHKLKHDILGNSSGFNLGVIYNLPMWKNLYFEPGVNIYYNTYSCDKLTTLEWINEDKNIEVDKVYSASVRQWGVRIPLLLGYGFDLFPDLRISVFTGPELSLGFKSRLQMDLGIINGDLPGYGKKGFMNRPDMKWRFGVSATYLDHYVLGISGAAGMCDMWRGEGKMRSNLFDITLGYNF